MDPEYPAWRAKQTLMQNCDLPETLVLGDSRAAADILPNQLPIPVVNLAVGGGEPIEALIAARHALACPHPPRRAILSLDPVHFTSPDLFWERSVRYGLVSAADLDELLDNSRRTHDFSVYSEHAIPGLPDQIRDWLYRVRFPSFEFASLMHAGGFMRWWSNNAIYQATLAARGHYYFGTAPGADDVAAEGNMKDFRPSPILDFYFNALLARLNAANVTILFVTMPVNEATGAAIRPNVRDGFAAYLRNYERRYANFHVVSRSIPIWPNRYFGDQFCHLNPQGAARFTAALSRLLANRSPDAWSPDNSDTVVRSLDSGRGS
jgi:hypothetical protein